MDISCTVSRVDHAMFSIASDALLLVWVSFLELQHTAPCAHACHNCSMLCSFLVYSTIPPHCPSGLVAGISILGGQYGFSPVFLFSFNSWASMQVNQLI